MTERAKDEKPFLSRWSERKHAARAEEAASPEPQPDDGRAPPATTKAQVVELDANRAAAEAIDLEKLTDKSDYAPFLRPGVPVALKNAALRRLWRSDPVFAVLDGLDGNYLDFRWPATGSEVVKTAWKVGRGFLAGDDAAAAEEKAASSATEPPAGKQPPAQEAPVTAGNDAISREPEGAPNPAREDEPRPGEQERAKVGLAKRLDFAAFAGEKGKG
ncbi:MAG: DUF3306 domain-containing protein [Propylenella sp.]